MFDADGSRTISTSEMKARNSFVSCRVARPQSLPSLCLVRSAEWRVRSGPRDGSLLADGGVKAIELSP